MGELWSFDKYLISLQKMDKNVLVKDLAFTKTLFWVQIHDLPLGDMNPSATCAIGSNISVVQEGLKEWGTQDGSSFMRIRVLVDTSKPLCWGSKSAVMMVTWVGLDSSTNDCLIFATGVDSYHTVTRIVIYGCKVEARILNKISNLVVD